MSRSRRERKEMNRAILVLTPIIIFGIGYGIGFGYGIASGCSTESASWLGLIFGLVMLISSGIVSVARRLIRR